MKTNSKVIALLSMLIALSIVGANIKIAGSIALDAAPAFLGTILLGPVHGAIIGFIAHLASALLAGFPYGPLIHLIVGAMMAVTMIAYGKVRFHKEKSPTIARIILSGIVALVFNTVISNIALLPFMPFETLLALFPLLVVASILNIIIAELLYVAIPASFKKKL